MDNFFKWMLINIFLPLSPIALKFFIITIGEEQLAQKVKILEMPELLFYSIFTCIIALNINLETRRNLFEIILRIFLYVVIVLDFVVLGMMYSQSIGPNALSFSFMAAIIPAIIAPVYKIHHDNLSRQVN